MKVRIEVVKCANCKMNNHFLYLSDFSYGERLVLFDNGTKYAYIDLLQDSVYSDFIDKVKVLKYKKHLRTFHPIFLSFTIP